MMNFSQRDSREMNKPQEYFAGGHELYEFDYKMPDGDVTITLAPVEGGDYAESWTGPHARGNLAQCKRRQLRQ